MLEYFKNDPNLGTLQLKDMPGKDINTPSILQKREMILKPQSIPEKKLMLKFESVDTEELKNVEITFEGDRAIFKIGEGEANHYQIPNDKKLWETQFMIISLNGQYYIRDLGFVHTSRIKLDKRSEVQIQKGSIVDLGKVVHYHFDKAIHHGVPTQEPSEAFYTMRPSDTNFDVDTEDFPHLRARPTWVSADENVDNIQNEINVYADGQKPVNSVGRSMKRDIQIKLKAVSADHCAIAYTQEKGWTITERGKDRLSSNGTFIFMKSMQQMNDHIPSDMIPLHDDMIISFVNYELRVRLNQKTKDEINQQYAAMEEYFAGKYQGAAAGAAAPEEPKEEEKEQPAYTAEVQPNATPDEAAVVAAAEVPEAAPAEAEAAEAVPASNVE
jgi:predicted component of type VI protein secretion system